MAHYLDAGLADRRQAGRMVTVEEFLVLKKKAIDSQWAYVPNTEAKTKKDPRAVLASKPVVEKEVVEDESKPVVEEAPAVSTIPEVEKEVTLEDMKQALKDAGVKGVQLLRPETIERKYKAL